MLAKLRKLFGETKMSWPLVVGMAIVAAAVCAVLNLIPALQHTSLSDMAVTPECWILFGIFISVNCKKWWEAGLKSLTFFVIATPLVYLIEAPFHPMGIQLLTMYGPRWMLASLLTFPAGCLAFLLKKGNWLSVVVLSVANVVLVYQGVQYANACITNFPNHLLSTIFCLATAVMYSYIFLPEMAKRHVENTFIAAAIIICMLIAGRGQTSTVYLPSGQDWKCVETDDSIVHVEITEGNNVTFSARHNGTVSVKFENDKGELVEYMVTVSGGSVYQDLMDTTETA